MKARDRALEDLHTRAQLEAADVMRDLIAHVLITTKAQFHGMNKGHIMSIEWYEQGLRTRFHQAAQQFEAILCRMRARAYVLSKASEAEILAQLQPGKQVRSAITPDEVFKIKVRPSMAGGELPARIQLYCDRLRRKIVSYAQGAAIQATDPQDFAIDVFMAMPKARKVTVPRRTLKPLREADEVRINKKPPVDIAIDNIDGDAWKDMLDAYTAEYIPKYRGPEYVIDLPTKEGDTWYAWELERDLTNEFVSSVRDGQISAARDAGITDFVWIAVIDDKTDPCCAWRDGLLISEIEDQISDHEDDDAQCNMDSNGLNPPLHFNCRCTLAPATDSIPDKPDDAAKDFEEWLNT